MQDRTWTLTMKDGTSYTDLSERDATVALDRLVHGLAPFAREPERVAAKLDASHELPLAA